MENSGVTGTGLSAEETETAKIKSVGQDCPTHTALPKPGVLQRNTAGSAGCGLISFSIR